MAWGNTKWLRFPDTAALPQAKNLHRRVTMKPYLFLFRSGHVRGDLRPPPPYQEKATNWENDAIAGSEGGLRKRQRFRRGDGCGDEGEVVLWLYQKKRASRGDEKRTGLKIK